MSSKFEQLLDFLINEEQDKAHELFHEIVVEKSREIYENLIAEEDEEESSEEDESVEEAYEEDEDETVESMFGEEEDEEDDNEFPVQDQTDDFNDDVVDPSMGADDDGDLDDGVGDPESPATKGDLEDLKLDLEAEFKRLMGLNDTDDSEFNDTDKFDDEDDDTFSDEETDELDDEGDEGEFGVEKSNPFGNNGRTESRGPLSQGEAMREYIEKVSVSMDGGLVGARTGGTVPAPPAKDGRSPVSSGSGKPTSGASSKNITQGDKGSDEDGTKPYGKVGGVVKSGGQFVGAGTKNVSASANSKNPDGAKLTNVAKPSNKEFGGVGAKTGGDKAGQTGTGETKSPLTGAPNRAK